MDLYSQSCFIWFKCGERQRQAISEDCSQYKIKLLDLLQVGQEELGPQLQVAQYEPTSTTVW